MKYHFKVHKEKSGGFWAECVELEACTTQGDTREKLRKSMFEALNLFLDEPPSSKVIFPLPKKALKGRNIETVSVEPKIALAFLLRKARLERGLTQKEAAKMLGWKNLYSYQRLENSKTANPSLMTIKELKTVFPELSIDMLLAA